MEMFAANPDRPPKLHLADDRAIRLRTRGAALLLGQRIQPRKYRSLRRSNFRKILPRVRTYQMKMNFRVAGRQFRGPQQFLS